MELQKRPKSNSATFIRILRSQSGEIKISGSKLLCEMAVNDQRQNLFLEFMVLHENKLVSINLDGNFNPDSQVTIQEASLMGITVEIGDESITDGVPQEVPTGNDHASVDKCSGELNRSMANGEYLNTSSTAKSTEKQVWSERDTQQLLMTYKTFMNEVGPMKKFKNKKAMWDHIASKLSRSEWSVDGGQCENRFKTVKKRKVKATTQNNTSGEVRADVPFEDELAEISAVDDAMVPLVMRGQGRVEYPKNANDGRQKDGESRDQSNPSPISGNNAKNDIRNRKRLHSNTEILEQFKLKEEARQQRHEEKMEQMKKNAEDRKEMMELKKREIALREEKNRLIREALEKKDPKDGLH